MAMFRCQSSFQLFAEADLVHHHTRQKCKKSMGSLTNGGYGVKNEMECALFQRREQRGKWRYRDDNAERCASLPRIWRETFLGCCNQLFVGWVSPLAQPNLQKLGNSKPW